MSDTFSISQLAREFGITTRTIRHYEDQGLIAPRRQGRTRVYSKRDRVRLKLVMRGKRLGMPLREIREIIEMYSAEHGDRAQLRTLCARLRDRRERLQQQRHDLEQVIREMEELESQCQISLRKQGESLVSS